MTPKAIAFAMCALAVAGLVAIGCGKSEPAQPPAATDEAADSAPAEEPPAEATEAAAPAQPAIAPASWDLPAPYKQAVENGTIAARGLDAAHRFLTFWLGQIDADSGLLPQYLQPLPGIKDPKQPEEFQRIWTTMNVASDMYPFLAIAAYLTDQAAYDGPIRAMLDAEKRLTTTPSGLPTDYLLDEKKQWDEPVHVMIFGASEYLKDGLVPLMEMTGDPIWTDRAKELADAMIANGNEGTPHGILASAESEVNGEIAQSLYRLFYMTGDTRYVQYVQAIGDAYFKVVMPANNGLPVHAWNFGKGVPYDGRLTLRDHGNEIVLGLALAYAMLHDQNKEVAAGWRPGFEKMLDRIAAEGRAENGFFVGAIDAKTGKVLDDHLSDNWGYLLAAYQILYDIHGDAKYLEPVDAILNNLDAVSDYRWEIGSDGLSDALESAVYFEKCRPSPKLRAWIEAQFARLAARQAESGFVDGTYLDGNFARTIMLVSQMESAGVRLAPWAQAVRVGANVDGESLYVAVEADADYAGTLRIDSVRWKDTLKLPADLPRVNEWPTWWGADPGAKYRLEVRDQSGAALVEKDVTGAELLQGVPISMRAGEGRYVVVSPL